MPLKLSILRLEETLDRKEKEYESMYLNLMMQYGYVSRRKESSRE